MTVCDACGSTNNVTHEQFIVNEQVLDRFTCYGCSKENFEQRKKELELPDFIEYAEHSHGGNYVSCCGKDILLAFVWYHIRDTH